MSLRVFPHPVAKGTFYASATPMNDRQVDATLDRLEMALARAEKAWAQKSGRNAEMHADAARMEAVRQEQLAALELRNETLKQAVTQGLRQLDEILDGINA